MMMMFIKAQKVPESGPGLVHREISRNLNPKSIRTAEKGQDSASGNFGNIAIDIYYPLMMTIYS